MHSQDKEEKAHPSLSPRPGHCTLQVHSNILPALQVHVAFRRSFMEGSLKWVTLYPLTFIFWGKYKSILWAYIIVDYILI